MADTRPNGEEVAFRGQMIALREANDLSQTNLAQKLREMGFSFHQQTIAKIEAGERPVRLEEAYAIASALGSTVTEMVSLRGMESWALKQAQEHFITTYYEVKRTTIEMMHAQLTLERAMQDAENAGIVSTLEISPDGKDLSRWDAISAVVDGVGSFAAETDDSGILDQLTNSPEKIAAVLSWYTQELQKRRSMDRRAERDADGEHREET